MLYNQYHDNEPNYKRFSNEVESITNLSFMVKKEFTNGISINLGINFIDWKNSNFNPYNPNNNNLVNVKKESFILGVSYNFNIKNQKSYINKNSIKLYND